MSSGEEETATALLRVHLLLPSRHSVFHKEIAMLRRFSTISLFALVVAGCDSTDETGGTTTDGGAAGDAGSAGTAGQPDAGGSGGTGGTGSTEPAALEVAGFWESNWGGVTTITEEEWGSSKVHEKDNDENFVILQSPPDDPYTPDQFAKYVWTEIEDGSFWYCTVDFGKETKEEAKNTAKEADDSDPANGGCEGFAWTRLFTAVEVYGEWSSKWSDETIVTADWNGNAIVEFDNETNAAIMQSPADDPYTANQFSKLVWTEIEDGSFWYCTVEFGKDTADEAKNSTNVADDGDLATAGCGGFPWTQLSPPIEVTGSWSSPWSDEDISSQSWNGNAVIEYDNATNVAITQSPADDPYTANKFSKIVWTEIASDAFWYCTVDFGKDTADEAKNTVNVADDSDPANSGCGGFSWTELTAK